MESLQSDTIYELENKALAIRALIIDIAARPTGCHIGGSLSVVDILVAAYGLFGQDDDNTIVLSKGHAAAALYATLYHFGLLHDDPALSYGSRESLFTGHPNHKIKSIPFSTGSLGHGIPLALGWSLGQKLKGRNGLSVVVVGDGELQEGLAWETFQIAQAKNLDNFIVVVDCNGGQNDGHVENISPMLNLRDRFVAFGFKVIETDGHNIENLLACFRNGISERSNKPLAILATTIKGKGVQALEGKAGSHYATIDLKTALRWKALLKRSTIVTQSQPNPLEAL